MKKLILIIIICLPLTSIAQTNKDLVLNLQQALTIGLNNRFDLKANQLNSDLAKNQIHKAQKAWIPEINIESSVQYSTQILPTYVPDGFAGFSEASLLAFGAKNTTVLGLSLNQPIFKPGINTNIEMDKVNLALQNEKIHGDEIDIKSGIATAYLNVLLKKLQFKIAQNEENRFLSYELLAQGKYQNGALIKNDFLRAKLDFENAKINTQIAQQNYVLAMDYLKKQINVPEKTNLVLSDSIEPISLEQIDSNKLNPLTDRTEIKQLELMQKQTSLAIKRTRQNALPTVSLVGYYAQMYQNQNFDYSASKWWAPHSYVGLQFSIPITENFSNRNNIREHNLQQQQLVMQMKQEQSNIDYQVRKATTDLENSRQNMQATQKNYKLSQEIYQNQKEQFAIGVFHYSDLLDTEKSLTIAEQNFIKAVYDYMEAKIAFQKAEGVW